MHAARAYRKTKELEEKKLQNRLALLKKVRCGSVSVEKLRRVSPSVARVLPVTGTAHQLPQNRRSAEARHANRC
jgi:hypothetical protein